MRSVADLVDVARAHANLHIRKPFARGMFFAQKIGHERMHPRRGKEHGGVVFRHERRRGYDRVSPLAEEIQICFAKFG